ncbi:MAG: DUF1028 domain-containing protein, partial [Hyphomicrobiales bacterium]
KNGNAVAFSGASNADFKGHIVRDGLVASGNILAGREVLEAMLEAMESTGKTLEDRLLAALEAGSEAGGDERGVQSAAMLVVSENSPTLDLRIDWHEAPISALGRLLVQTRRSDYREWLDVVPTGSDPFRTPEFKNSAKDI